MIMMSKKSKKHWTRFVQVYLFVIFISGMLGIHLQGIITQNEILYLRGGHVCQNGMKK